MTPLFIAPLVAIAVVFGLLCFVEHCRRRNADPTADAAAPGTEPDPRCLTEIQRRNARFTI